jgi:hypothetical protein
MKYRIEYYDCGDARCVKVVEAPTLPSAIEKLADDPQNPLGQVISASPCRDEEAQK